MPPASPLRSRLERQLRRVPIPAIRDVVSKQPSAGRNLDALDGVRGLAVLIVVAAHTEGFHMKGHGAVGVWLFFALSAFLLTLPFAARPEHVFQLPRLRHYAARRIKRILPAYYFAIVVLALLTTSSFTFLWQHFAFIRATGIFWTIPQEMLFYLLLPLLVALHPSVFRRNFAATILGLSAIALASNLWLTLDAFALHGNGKLLPFYLGIFVSGMVFAYAYQYPALARFVARPFVNRALDVAGLLTLALLALVSPYVFENYLASIPGLESLDPRLGLRYKHAYGVLSGFLIYVTMVCEGRWTHWIVSSLPLRAMGVVCFSLYLFHVMVQSLLGFRLLGFEAGNALFFFTLATTYVVACITYTLVERPFLKIRTR
jgi:peptidoglycan/LPS O-acetylase OafA/YrhL